MPPPSQPRSYHDQQNTREEAKTGVTQQVQPQESQWMNRVKQRDNSISFKGKSNKIASTYDRREGARHSGDDMSRVHLSRHI